jgi:glutaredoxin
VKEYLSQKGVKFQEFDVGKDREKAKEMIQKSNQMSVPVIMIGDQMVLGFNQARIDELLAQEVPADSSTALEKIPPGDNVAPEA